MLRVALVPKRGPKEWSPWLSVAVLEHTHLLITGMLYLQNGLHIGADESGGIGDQVPQHAGTLLLDSPNTTVLQLCQNL